MTYQCSKVSRADMFLAFLVISHLTLISVGNPFQKYPYVFLLDVGNEELEKTNTEQIRLSVPGGSLAVRYPALGNGDTIGHLRVSGVDFGTYLKSSVVDGGPGYKYVVLAFIGNPGVPYDVVVTVQTVAEDNNSVQNIEDQDMNTDRNFYRVEENSNSKAVSEDENNSAEDLSDDTNTSETQYSEKTNSEIVQLSSDAYKYAQNEVNNEDCSEDDDNDNDDDDDIDSTKDIHRQYIENPNLYNQVNTEENTRGKGYIKQNKHQADDQNGETENQSDGSYEKNDPNDKLSDQNYEEKYSKEEKSTNEDFDDELDNEKEAVRYVDRNLYNKYNEALQTHLFNGVTIYPEDPDVSSEKTVHDNPTEIDQMFNDEEIHNDGEKYTDSNNNSNYFDSDDSSAVAY